MSFPYKLVKQLSFIFRYFSTYHCDQIEEVIFENVVSESSEYSLEIDIFWVDVEAEIGHDEVDLSLTLLFALKMFFILSSEERMQKYLFPIKTFVLIDTDTTEDELFHVVTDL